MVSKTVTLVFVWNARYINAANATITIQNAILAMILMCWWILLRQTFHVLTAGYLIASPVQMICINVFNANKGMD